MPLGFGLLSAQARPGVSLDWERAYDETLRLTEHSERIGFTSVWTTEHHFVDDGYMPSLLVTSAAMAARTERIKIGTGVLLAPMHDPLRLAEDAATVQIISNGRLELGLGLGWSRIEFEALRGVERDQRGRSMEEILHILPKAWTGNPFRFQGDVYDLPEVGIRPAPGAAIPILIGGGAEAAIRRAARLADGLFSNALPDEFVQQVAWARDEMERVGRDPQSFRWLHYSVLYPASSAERGWEEITPHLWQMSWKYRDMGRSASRSSPIPTAPDMTSDEKEALRFRSTFVGPSDWIVDRLNDVREAAGVPVEFSARSYFSTLPYERQAELMDRLAAEVAPHV